MRAVSLAWGLFYLPGCCFTCPGVVLLARGWFYLPGGCFTCPGVVLLARLWMLLPQILPLVSRFERHINHIRQRQGTTCHNQEDGVVLEQDEKG